MRKFFEKNKAKIDWSIQKILSLCVDGQKLKKITEKSNSFHQTCFKV